MKLYTSISSALEKICPTPVINGQRTGCSTEIITIAKIVYIEKASSTTDTILNLFKSGKSSRDLSPRKLSPLEISANAISPRESGPISMVQREIKHTGALEVRVETSSYRDGMIIAAATVANVSSTSDDSCKTHKLEETVDLDTKAEQVLCTAAEFAGIHYYDGTLAHSNRMRI